MWTHNIINKGYLDNQSYRVDVELTNGSKKVVRFYSPSNYEGLKQSIQADLNRLNDLDTLDPQIFLGVIDLTPVADISIDKDRVAFRTNYVLYVQLTKAISAGLGKPDQAYTDLQALIKSTYKDEYANIIKELGN